jgi:hypothetical protein
MFKILCNIYNDAKTPCDTMILQIPCPNDRNGSVGLFSKLGNIPRGDTVEGVVGYLAWVDDEDKAMYEIKD